MKLTAVLALVAAATVVSAETNAARLARGLSPNPPVKRASPALMARHGKPSGSPSQCNTGSLNCCNSVDQAGSGGSGDSLMNLLGITDVASGTQLGLNCSPITGIGAGAASSCKQQPVCCTGNSYSGLINIGCSPINVNL